MPQRWPRTLRAEPPTQRCPQARSYDCRQDPPVSTSQTEIQIGSDFLGYRIEELIGQGGMGVVYRAYDLRLKRTVALKLIAPELALDERFHARFARETELAMSLEHPNVVPVYDAGDVDGRFYLAMRLVEGTDLGRCCAPRARSTPPAHLPSAARSRTPWMLHTRRISSIATSSPPTCCSMRASMSISPTSG